MVMKGERMFVFTNESEGNFCGSRRAVCGSAREPGQKLQEDIEYMDAKQNRLLAAMERKQNLMNGGLG